MGDVVGFVTFTRPSGRGFMERPSTTGGVGFVSVATGDIGSDGVVDHRCVVVARDSVRRESGDCARVVSRPDGRTLFFVADVAGHDARAARLADQLDAFVLAIAERATPGAVLGAVNVVVQKTWPPDVFVSAICFVLDPETGRGSIAVAGQAPPLVRRRSCCHPLIVDAGPALGILAAQRYTERDFVLAVDDVLVAVTDGVTDPLATDADVLGTTAMARVVDGAPWSPEGVCWSLLEAARPHSLGDDATVLVVARRRWHRVLEGPGPLMEFAA